MNPSPQPAPVSLTQKFVSGELQFGLWGIIARGIGWANSLFIISALTVYQYGVFQLFLSGYAILMEFVSWGGLAAGTDILRFAGRGDEARAKRLFYEYNGLRIITALILWALLFFGAPMLAFRYEPNFIELVRIMSFMLLGETALAMVTTVINLRLNFRALASRRAIGKSFQLAILAGFFLFGTIGIREVLLSLVIGHILATVILIPAALRAWQPWRGIRIERGPSILWKIARAHGKWDSIKNITSQFGTRAQPWLIKIFVNTEAVGLYGVAMALAEIVMQTVPRNTMNTLISKIFFDKERSQRVYTYAVKYLLIWSVVGAVGAAIVAPFAVSIFFPQYIPALPLFYLLLLAVPMKSLQWISDLFLRMFRQQKFAFVRMIGRNTAFFASLLILLPLIGIWAVPITEVLVRLSVLSVSYNHLLKLRPEFRVTRKMLFSFGLEDQKILGGIITNIKSFIRRR